MVAISAFEFLEPDAIVGANTGGMSETPTTPDGSERQRQESDKGKPPASVERVAKYQQFHDKYLLKTFLVLLVTALVSVCYYDSIILQPTCDLEQQLKGKF